MLQHFSEPRLYEVDLLSEGQVHRLQQVDLAHAHKGRLGGEQVVKRRLLHHLLEVVRKTNDLFVLVRLPNHVEHVVENVADHCDLGGRICGEGLLHLLLRSKSIPIVVGPLIIIATTILVVVVVVVLPILTLVVLILVVAIRILPPITSVILLLILVLLVLLESSHHLLLVVLHFILHLLILAL
jgi:hypothetical protein